MAATGGTPAPSRAGPPRRPGAAGLPPGLQPTGPSLLRRGLSLLSKIVAAMVLPAVPVAAVVYAVHVWTEPLYIVDDRLYLLFHDYGAVVLGLMVLSLLISLARFVHWFAAMILLGLSAVALIPFAGALAYIIYTGPICSLTRMTQAETTDGAWRYYLEESDCGTRADATYQVAVRELGTEIARQTVIFTARERPIPDEIRYDGDNRFTLSFLDYRSEPPTRTVETVTLDRAAVQPDYVIQYIRGARQQ